MKRFIASIIFFSIPLGITQPTFCGFEERFEKKLDEANETFRKNLTQGFTNGAIKFGGIGIGLISLACFIIPELQAYLNATKKNDPNKREQPTYIWNRKKLITGTIGILAGISLLAFGDRITNYFYPKI